MCLKCTYYIGKIYLKNNAWTLGLQAQFVSLIFMLCGAVLVNGERALLHAQGVYQ